MLRARRGFLIAFILSLAFHAGLMQPWLGEKSKPPVAEEPMQLRIMTKPEVPAPPSEPQKVQAPKPPKPPKSAKLAMPQAMSETPLVPLPEKVPTSMSAPPAPTAEEWQLASTYTLRNSKRYRYAWGQQVRSMMGTALEGPGQGQVRFRIEIAPDGTIANVKELWSTSDAASKLAWTVIRKLPPLPPTPTGKPLVFDHTISFLSYETGWPPSYQLDCLPEPEPFKNPFAWDGTSAPKVVRREHRPPPPEGCPPDSTAPTIEEEEHEMKRQTDQWRWGR